jgi:hypothetical protein
MSHKTPEERITTLEEGQEEILKLLKPISETYSTVSHLGKWVMAILVFISILLGILLGAKNLIK